MGVTLYVAIPFGFGIVMTLIEGFIDPQPFCVKTIKTGWDMCVLSVGILGGMLAERRAIDGDSLGVGILGIAVILILGLIIGQFRRPQRINHFWHAVLSVALGGLAIAIPIVWALMYVKEAHP
jgi:hypothetical protein